MDGPEGIGMQDFLILKLAGPMQAWGGHTFEDKRPSHDFPTRSGLIGLLAACMGLDRRDSQAQSTLARSIRYAARSDARVLERQAWDEAKRKPLAPVKLVDYHTIRKARRANRPPKEGETVQSWREYLFDAVFTVAIGTMPNATIRSLDELEAAVRKPVYTPFLGRRACPLSRPLFEARVKADSLLAALIQSPPGEGLIYSEEDVGDAPRLLVRDVPLWRQHRQFSTRSVYFKYQERKT